ncbi:MAG: homoserine dehydrogenase [Eubacteriales bacterium]|jgi:homoserine dehydrogenase
MIKAAVLGFGVVGSGTAEILVKDRELLERSAGCGVELKYIVDIREFPDSPFADRIVHDFSVVEQDPEVNVVIEVIGGAKVAYDFTKRALLAGKHVVTSNKELVATHGQELLTIARERNLNYLFEASVGGGIPVIRPLNQCLVANRIEEISGILNGTTNYILTQMIEEGKSFETALADAQKNGYAEQNPAADIEGVDACRKIAILASLACGKRVDPQKVHTEGITHVTLNDVALAGRMEKVIKLLGRFRQCEDGRMEVLVAPYLIPVNHQLAHISGVFNGVYVTGSNVGDVMMYGQGAGKLATASAVVADVVDIAHHLEKRRAIYWEDSDSSFVKPQEECLARYYVRVSGEEEAVRKAVEQVLGQVEMVSSPACPGELALLTSEDTEKNLNALVEKLGTLQVAVLSVMRVLY